MISLIAQSDLPTSKFTAVNMTWEEADLEKVAGFFLANGVDIVNPYLRLTEHLSLGWCIDKKAAVQADELVGKAKSELISRYKKYKKLSDKQKDIDMYWFYQGRAEACWEAIVVLEYLTDVRKDICSVSDRTTQRG